MIASVSPTAWPSTPSSSLYATTPSVRPNTPYSQLRIVHTNDTHEAWANMPKTVTAFDVLSRQGNQAGADVIRTHSGDYNTNTELNEFGLSVALNNLMNLDASIFGNHELYLPLQGLVNTLQQGARYPTLVNNLAIHPANPLTQLKQTGHLNPSVQIVRGQQGPYALIGLTRPTETAKLPNSIKAQGLNSVSMAQTCQGVQQLVNQLEAQGLNRIIVLSHMGYKLDQQLAQSVSGVDVIVGGDSHDTLQGIVPGKTLFQSPRGEPVLIVQAGANGQHVGTADVMFDPWGRVIPMAVTLHNTQGFPNNPLAEQLIAQTIEPQRLVGYLAQPLSIEGIRSHPHPLGQTLANMIWAHSGADVALVRGQQIRTDLPAGPVTNWHLKQSMPYSGQFMTVTVPGQTLLQVLNRQVQGLPVNKTSYLHRTGLDFSVNPTTGTVQSAQLFNRQTQRWEPLNPFKPYTVTIDDFSLTESDEYPELRQAPRTGWQGGRPLRWYAEQALTFRRS